MKTTTKSSRNGRFRMSPALVLSSVAVFVALGGGAYASHAHKIDTKDIKAGAVTNGKLAEKVKSRWAIVQHNGSLVRGRTATDAGKVGNADSLYAVTFKHDVSKCAYVATLTEITGGDNLGFVSTAVSGSDPNEVIVETRDLDGASEPRSFHLQVSC